MLLTQIPGNQPIRLLTAKYDDGTPISRVMVISSTNNVLQVQPAKCKNKVVKTQSLVVSPFVVGELKEPGTVLLIDKQGLATHYQKVSGALFNLIKSEYLD